MSRWLSSGRQPSEVVASAGSIWWITYAPDALEMIADAVNEALTDGATPGYGTDSGALDALYQELVQAGLPTAEVAIWLPDPGDGYARRAFAPKPAHAGGIRKIGG